MNTCLIRREYHVKYTDKSIVDLLHTHTHVIWTDDMLNSVLLKVNRIADVHCSLMGRRSKENDK